MLTHNNKDRLLILSPYIPYPPDDGAKIRMLQIINALTCNYTCSLLSFRNNNADHVLNQLTKEFTANCNISELFLVNNIYIPNPIRRLLSILSMSPCEIWMSFSDQYRSILNKSLRRFNYKAIVILGSYNLIRYSEYIRSYKIFWDLCDDIPNSYRRRADLVNNLIYKVYYRIQAYLHDKYLMRYYDKIYSVFVISEEDAKRIKNRINKHSFVLPNGIDTRKYSPDNLEYDGEDNALLFVGAFSSWTNIDAFNYFINDILPVIKIKCPNVKFQVIGKYSESMKPYKSDDNVSILGFVEDLTKFYRECDVFVCPLRAGAGIKNKLLEAMACGCAIVTTSIGAEGLAVRHGEELLIANSVQDFVNATVCLLKNREMRQVMGDKASGFIKKNFSSIAVSNRLKKLITN